MRKRRIPWATAVSAAAALVLTLAAAPGLARAAAPPDGWAITLTATLPGFPERGQLTLGASSAASDGADSFDTPAPPLFPADYLDLYSEHSRSETGWDGQAVPTLHYGAEYQSPLGTTERVVPFVMATSHAGLFTLAWSGVSGADLDRYNVLLEDGATGERIDLRSESSHTFTVSPSAHPFRLHLVPGRGALTPPVVTAGGDQTATEGPGTPINLGSLTDTGADGPWTADVDWGDGTPHVSQGVASPGSLPSLAHGYADNGSYTVTVQVTDQAGASGTATFRVAVANAPPSAVFGAPPSVDAGSPIALSLTGAADPSPADTAAGFTYAFDCGDGSGYGSPGTADAVSCPTTAPGTRLVKGKVMDKDGGSAEYTATVSVNRVPVPPAASFTLDVAAPAEGQGVTFTDTSADSDGQIAGRTWDWGDGSAPVTGQSSVTHQFSDNGTYTVTLILTDNDGLTAQAQKQVTVVNAPPILTAPPDQTATAGTASTFTMGAFSDPGADSPWNVVVDWGDGSPDASLTAAAPGPLAPQAHTYAAAGTYRVTLTVTDKDGASASAGFTVTVAPAGQCQPFTWLTPPDGAAPYDLPVGSTLTLRFRWGDCTRFIHDESVIVQVENPNDPNLPITTWVYGYDIIIDDAAGEYRVDFTPSLYGLAPGTSWPVTVYIGNQLVGQAILHLTQ